MKHVNKVGPNIVEELPAPKNLSTFEEIEEALRNGAQVIDTREAAYSQKGTSKGR